MERVEKLFTEKLAFILRVLDSCQTPEQLANAKRWGGETLAGIVCLIEHGGSAEEERLAQSFKRTTYNQVKQRYLEKLAEMTDPQVHTVIRNVAPHVSICRYCGGIGLHFDLDEMPYKCKFCNGTGKVKVSSRVVTKVRAFTPGKDDAGKPITME